MKAWAKSRAEARSIGQLGIAVLALLILPTLVGLVIDRQAGSFPWVTLIGTLAGVILASFNITATILGRYERLAPSDPKEEHR